MKKKYVVIIIVLILMVIGEFYHKKMRLKKGEEFFYETGHIVWHEILEEWKFERIGDAIKGFEEYLKRYPDGRSTWSAREIVADLKNFQACFVETATKSARISCLHRYLKKKDPPRKLLSGRSGNKIRKYIAFLCGNDFREGFFEKIRHDPSRLEMEILAYMLLYKIPLTEELNQIVKDFYQEGKVFIRLPEDRLYNLPMWNKLAYAHGLIPSESEKCLLVAKYDPLQKEKLDEWLIREKPLDFMEQWKAGSTFYVMSKGEVILKEDIDFTQKPLPPFVVRNVLTEEQLKYKDPVPKDLFEIRVHNDWIRHVVGMHFPEIQAPWGAIYPEVRERSPKQYLLDAYVHFILEEYAAGQASLRTVVSSHKTKDPLMLETAERLLTGDYDYEEIRRYQPK